MLEGHLNEKEKNGINEGAKTKKNSSNAKAGKNFD